MGFLLSRDTELTSSTNNLVMNSGETDKVYTFDTGYRITTVRHNGTSVPTAAYATNEDGVPITGGVDPGLWWRWCIVAWEYCQRCGSYIPNQIRYSYASPQRFLCLCQCFFQCPVIIYYHPARSRYSSSLSWLANIRSTCASEYPLDAFRRALRFSSVV